MKKITVLALLVMFLMPVVLSQAGAAEKTARTEKQMDYGKSTAGRELSKSLTDGSLRENFLGCRGRGCTTIVMRLSIDRLGSAYIFLLQTLFLGSIPANHYSICEYRFQGPIFCRFSP